MHGLIVFWQLSQNGNPNHCVLWHDCFCFSQVRKLSAPIYCQMCTCIMGWGLWHSVQDKVWSVYWHSLACMVKAAQNSISKVKCSPVTSYPGRKRSRKGLHCMCQVDGEISSIIHWITSLRHGRQDMVDKDTVYYALVLWSGLNVLKEWCMTVFLHSYLTSLDKPFWASITYSFTADGQHPKTIAEHKQYSLL